MVSILLFTREAKWIYNFSMKIVLEEKAKLVSLGIGYCQIIDGDYFEPAAIGFTNEAIVIYSDQSPDEIQNDTYAYSIKKKIPLSGIKAVVIEKLKHNPDLKYFCRLNIITNVVENSVSFYYDTCDKKFMKRFIGACKFAEIRVTKASIDMRPID